MWKGKLSCVHRHTLGNVCQLRMLAAKKNEREKVKLIPITTAYSVSNIFLTVEKPPQVSLHK